MTDLNALARAARPGLFETMREPELLIVLVLANLMTPALWATRDKIIARAEKRPEGPGETREHRLLNEALHFVDNHFTHLVPMDLVEAAGVIDIDAARIWVGAKHVDQALADIETEMSYRYVHGTVEAGADPTPLFREGHFPNYSYMTIEGMRAQRALLHRTRHKPIGVSVCADEASLLVALVCSLGEVSLREFAILGSAAHYSVLFFGAGDRYFWTNGKREFFDKTRWRQLVASGQEGNAQEVYNRRQVSVERIISPRGTAFLQEARSSLSAGEAVKIDRAARDFFGTDLIQLAPLLDLQIKGEMKETLSQSFDSLEGAQSAAEVRSLVGKLARRFSGSVYEKSLYCLREITVAHPEAYLVAAINGSKLRAAAQDVTSFDDGLDYIKGISNKTSAREHPDHICMPDETILFQRGDYRDRALLLFALLVAAPGMSLVDRSEARLDIGPTRAFVSWQGRSFETRSWQFADLDETQVMTIQSSLDMVTPSAGWTPLVSEHVV
ncbi:hypothetical protein [Ruegeria jejuensis]|uniref:hypothetical protein n=1 Tax=Ruegeria jejuensis TaxID=3233338 RepID=UPI00355BBD7E